MKPLSLIVVAVVALGSTGCVTIPWGVGTGVEMRPDAVPVPNGLVVVLGPEALASAAGRVTASLNTAWPEGIELAGEAHILGEMLPELEGLVAVWDEAWLDTGIAQLRMSDEGLWLEVPLSSDPFLVRLPDLLSDDCGFTLTVQDAVLAGALSLDRDKLGRVVVEGLEGLSVQAEVIQTDWPACGEHVWSGNAVEVADIVLEAVATSVEGWLATELNATLPSALGLNLAVGTSVIVDGGGVGTGTVNIAVETPSNNGGGLVHRVGDSGVFPFSVSLSVDANPCAPEVKLPNATGYPIPALGDEARTGHLLNVDLLRQTIFAAWATGAPCGSRASREVELFAGDLATLWPEVDAFGPDAVVELVLWPGSAPSVELEPRGDGAGVALDTGSFTVEIYVLLDGASVLLSEITASASVSAQIASAPESGISLVADQIEISGIERTPGLVASPAPVAAEAIAELLAREVVDALPPIPLPWMPGMEPASEVLLMGDYLFVGR